MKKGIRSLVLKVFSIFILLFILIITVSFVNHKIQLSKEEKLFVPPGQLVEVNGHQMHVYEEGQGVETLVFMSGGGTSSPVLDFKSLYSLLSDQYKIVVVEKLGYGFSEVTTTDRDIETILAETREALLKAGVDGPYILLPHSMSGIEALHWAQKYPDELRAIIGLDMATPAAYEKFDINMPLVRLGAFVAHTGITRWIPSLVESDAIKYGRLTDEEKALYKIVFFRRTGTKNMINEIKNINDNAQKVKMLGIPDVPLLLFTSNGQATGFDEEEWLNIQNEFVAENDNAKLIELDAPHYIHNYEYEQIAQKLEEFINSLQE